MNSFQFEIPNERTGVYRTITLIVFLLNFFGFGFLFLRTEGRFAFILCIAGLLLSAVPALFWLLNKRHLRSPLPEVFLFVLALLWLITGAYPVALAIVVSSFFGFLSNKKKRIFLTEEGVSYPSFPSKQFGWEEIEQVILKDGVLSIDLRDNRLLQNSPERNSLPGEDTFNAWCRAQIAAASAAASPLI